MANDTTGPSGLVVAVLTPLNADLSCDSGRLTAHCEALLARGCAGIALFGSTGEAPSFTVAERTAVLEVLLAAGLPPARMLVGTGCPALADAEALTRHAVGAGCAGVFAVPPYFFKGVNDDGLVEAYARVIDGVADGRLRLFLYNLPALVGFNVGADVLRRLHMRYPEVVAGIKDSSGDWPNTERLLCVSPELRVFTGWEPHLAQALALGAACTVSGTANAIPELIASLCNGEASDAVAQQAVDLCEIVAGYPGIAALKSLMAHFTGEPAWERLRPPLTPLSAAQRRQVVARFAEAGVAGPRAA